MRVLIASLEHETNTYCKGLTPRSEFRGARGPRVEEVFGGTRTDVGGMLEACRTLGATPVPSSTFFAQPSGTIAREAYLEMRDEILADVERGDFDVVALGLHGAGVVDGLDDLEADLAEEVRQRVGPDVPVAATFDLHGNVTQRMADALDASFVCHEYPHVDLFERGVEAVEFLAKRHRGELPRPSSHVETVPTLLPTSTTMFGPAKQIKDRCLELETELGLIDCSFFHGFPYTDTPLVGAHVIAIAEDRERAKRAAQTAARELWELRDAFRAQSLSADEAVQAALRARKRPVVINETSDNPGGGTPGDGTHLLRAMISAEVPNAAFGYIVDPKTATQAHDAGEGALIDVELGGRYDDLHGAPIRTSARVVKLSDGRFVHSSPMAKGLAASLGPTARLEIGGIDVVVGSYRSQTFDAGPFEVVGIDVRKLDVVALKSSNHFRASFTELAGEIVTADPPGLTTHHIEVFPRKRAPGPLWPLDPDASWQPRA